MATTFPAGFTWGAATASYQIEGAANEDGRGESIWDRFSHTPGKVANGDTGDVAADHYHRWRQDIDLMRTIGLGAYRFSVAWPRIIPDGTGAVNEAGLDFYSRLVDGLLEAGIEPFVTLYHWDLPQALQDRGGWPERASVGWFTDYAAVVSRRLGDRVRFWMTHNEPFVAGVLGYIAGVHAPGLADMGAGLRALYHLLLSHGQATPVLRQNGRPDTQVGIALNLNWVDAVSERPEDLAAARQHDGFLNRFFLDPIFKGACPEDMQPLIDSVGLEMKPEDLQQMAVPIDFMGVNNYSRSLVAADADAPGGGRQVLPPEAEYTDMGWEVYPEGLYKLLLRLHQEYQPKAIYVTENGAAFADQVDEGRVHDPRRVAYLQAYLAQAQRAIAEGVPLRGYFVWSLLDNFEWAYGYAKRFGIVYVDYASQARILKDSALFYQQVIAANALP